MHAHILTKVWEQKRGHCDMQKGDAHVCTELCKRVGANLEIQVDMYICTDACTHSN